MLANYLYKNTIEAGCDEAGRGCLAGPVFAAAVIIPKGVKIKGLNDSKQVPEHIRKELRLEIEAKCFWKVAQLDSREIDRINILNASIQSMHLALEAMTNEFEHILVDGNRFKTFRNIPHTTVIKGDEKLKCIAAASILAKTHRDEFMENLSLLHPHYLWHQNKGYPTLAHRDAIREHGITEYHRKTFTLLPEQMNLFEQDFSL
jgi:ribonuclease HII